MQASLMRPPSNIFPQTRNSGEKKRRDRNQVAVASREQVRRGVCCIRTKKTSFLKRERERGREQENLLLPVAWYSNQSIRSFAGVAKRQPAIRNRSFFNENGRPSPYGHPLYMLCGDYGAQRIDETMGEDFLPVRLRGGMVIRARISRIVLRYFAKQLLFDLGKYRIEVYRIGIWNISSYEDW